MLLEQALKERKGEDPELTSSLSALISLHERHGELNEVPEEVAGCEDCLKIGGTWVHLRVCRSCGHVGCCDSSPNRHASAGDA